MTSDDEVQIIAPSTVLQKKAAKPGGITMEEATGKGNAAVGRIAKDYGAHAQEDMADLSRLLGAWLEAPAASVRRTAFYRKLQDLRGQAGTFGFPLVTNIAASLSVYLDGLPEDGAPAREVLVMHVEAMRAVFGQNLRGAGGPAEQQIVLGLQAVVRKTLG